MKPRIYVAAPWICKEQAKEARELLIAAGFEVTSRWLDVEIDPNATEDELTIQKQQEALHDAEDVFSADALLLLNISKSEGKAVETGLAMAWQIPVILVGQRTNIFHYLPVPVVETVPEAIVIMKEWENSFQAKVKELEDRIVMEQFKGDIPEA